MSNPSKPAAPASTPKPSHPIDLLPNTLARITSQAHPAILLSTYCLLFPSLVSSPVSTLLNSLFPLAVVQVAYAACCLPAVGSNVKIVKKVKLNAPRGKDSALSTKAFTIIFSLLLALVSTPVLAIIQILFGAPLTTHLPHTLLSSAHIALLAIFPLVYVHGADGVKWREAASLYSPLDEVFGGSVGALVGAWVGAVPIPLDWDREWQKWPVTIVTGVYGGYVVGKVIGGWLCRGKRIELD